MSSLIVETGAGLMSGTQLAEPIRRRIREGRDHRKQFEPGWMSDGAFAAGKHNLVFDRQSRSLVPDPGTRDQEVYTADVITEYRTTALGELASDDDRPELLLRRDDAPSESFQRELNKAVEWGWDNEWEADAALAEADEIAVDFGTSAIRCRWEPNHGPVVQQNVPFLGGRPVLNTEQASSLFANGPNPDVEMRDIQQGRICWDSLSPLNLIVPPGVPRERYFPWEAVVRPALLSKVQEEFGEAAADLKEDTDIGSLYGWTLDTGTGGRTSGASPTTRGRLRDHVWLFTYYERPTGKYPQGRTVTLASNKLTPLRFDDRLPYQGPDGAWRSGISYFHWWRVTGRFWSRGLVSVMKDPQRLINKRLTQINAIIDRGMPYTLVEKDSQALARSGVPGEFVELAREERQPLAVQGVQPGAWMQGDIEASREHLEHATGIKGVRLGENPANVTTYSQLALVNENDQGKRQQIVKTRRQAIGTLVEDSVHDIRTYWGSQRQIMLAGDQDEIDHTVFDATKVPAFYIVRRPKGTAKPRSQAAELQKIQDIATYSTNAAQPVPASWYKDSLEAGEALDLPEEPTDEQAERAAIENHLMLQGEPAEADYFDPPGTHIPIHRSAQIQARLSSDRRAFDLIEQHVQQHLQLAAANAAQIQASAGQQAPPAAPGAPAPPPAAPTAPPAS